MSDHRRDLWLPEFNRIDASEVGDKWPTYVVEKWEVNGIGERRFTGESRTYRPHPLSFRRNPSNECPRCGKPGAVAAHYGLCCTCIVPFDRECKEDEANNALIDVTAEEDGSWSVSIKAMPGHVGAADSLSEAYSEAYDAAVAWIEALRENDPALEKDGLRWRKAEAEGHIVDFTEDGFGLQHPPSCRPDLVGCQYNVWLSEADGPEREPGRYQMILRDDGGDREAQYVAVDG